MKTANLRRLMALALSASALVVAPAALQAQESEPGAGKTVRMAQPTWDTGWFEGAVYKQMIEKLGYTVDGPTTLDNPPFYQAVGQGDIDLWVSGWFPFHNTYEAAYSQGAEIVGTVAAGGALEGYLVDKASADKYNIKTLDDFKRDEVKEAFDRDGDGKADLVACPPGWGCEILIDHHMEAYELGDHINQIKAAYAASMGDAVAAQQSGQPILFYTWTPNWTVDVLKPGKDVVWIEVPKVDLPENVKGLEDAATRAGVEGCVSDPCRLGFPASDIRPVANSEFLTENPAVRALLEEASLPVEDIYAQNAKMNDGEGSDADVARHASEWIAANEELVNGWLEKARAAAQ